MTARKRLLVSMLIVAVAATAAGLLSCSRRPAGRRVVLDLPAQQQWIDTGLDVTGKNVQIKYESGTWSSDGSESHRCDGEGLIPETQDFRDLIPKLVAPNAPLGALVGKTDSQSFFVGNSYEGSPGGGHLYLSINEKPDSFDDNTGSIRIAVTVLD